MGTILRESTTRQLTTAALKDNNLRDLTPPRIRAARLIRLSKQATPNQTAIRTIPQIVDPKATTAILQTPAPQTSHSKEDSSRTILLFRTITLFKTQLPMEQIMGTSLSSPVTRRPIAATKLRVAILTPLKVIGLSNLLRIPLMELDV